MGVMRRLALYFSAAGVFLGASLAPGYGAGAIDSAANKITAASQPLFDIAGG